MVLGLIKIASSAAIGSALGGTAGTLKGGKVGLEKGLKAGGSLGFIAGLATGAVATKLCIDTSKKLRSKVASIKEARA